MLFDLLTDACTGRVAGLKSETVLLPAEGAGGKVFPPTYDAGGKTPYVVEARPPAPGSGLPPESVVLLDSVQSQANRMEQALKKAWEQGVIPLPVVQTDIPGHGRVTSLDAPHRIADAIFRDCMLNGKPFLESPEGASFAASKPTDATAVYTLCPTALLFGVWHSQGKAGGMGCRFARALVSEITGEGAHLGACSSSRLDPLNISAKVGIYEAPAGDWVVDPAEAVQDRKGPKRYGKKGKPSEINHGNVTPSIAFSAEGGNGGVRIREARQTAVLSFPQLRRLVFPINGKVSEDVNVAGRTVLAALALVALTLMQEEGFDLRSRCLLVPQGPSKFSFLGIYAQKGSTTPNGLYAPEAIRVLKQAIARAEALGLFWREESLVLMPSRKLVDLVRKSQEAQAAPTPDFAGE